MSDFFYRVYYIGYSGREEFIKEIDYKGFVCLLAKYDGFNGLRVFKFGKYILIINNNPDYDFVMNKA